MAQTLIVAVAVTLVLQTVSVTHSNVVPVAELMMIAMVMVVVMTNPRKSAGWSKNTPCEEGNDGNTKCMQVYIQQVYNFTQYLFIRREFTNLPVEYIFFLYS